MAYNCDIESKLVTEIATDGLHRHGTDDRPQAEVGINKTKLPRVGNKKRQDRQHGRPYSEVKATTQQSGLKFFIGERE